MQKSQKSECNSQPKLSHQFSHPSYSCRNNKTNKFILEQYQNLIKDQLPSQQNLINQLHYLLSHEQVVNHMGNLLYERVENVLAVTQAEQQAKKNNQLNKKNSKNQNVLQEINCFNINKIQNIKFATCKNDQLAKLKSQNTHFSDTKNSRQNHKHRNINAYSQDQLYQPKDPNKSKKKQLIDKDKDKNSQLPLENKKINKQKYHQGINHQSQKKIGTIDQTNINTFNKYKTKFKVITEVPTHGRNNQNMKSAKSSTSKSKDKKLSKSQSMGKLQRCKVKFGTLIFQKQKINQKIIPSVNITAQTTKDSKHMMKQLKLKLDSCNLERKKYQDKSMRKNYKNKQINNKNNKIQSEIANVEPNLSKQNKYQTPNNINNDHLQFQPQDKQKPLNSHKQQKPRNPIKKQFNATLQFMQQISQLQRQTQDQQQILQQSIKWIKNQINFQKTFLQSTTKNITLLKQQINNININSTGLNKKKKQNHIKLEGTWNQVKQLNQIISQTKKQQEEVKINLDDEAQLMRMYHTVIQQLKQQFKIQMQSRDNVKSKLKQSKKSQYALKLKAKTAKQKNDLILGVVRDSLSKWKG